MRWVRFDVGDGPEICDFGVLANPVGAPVAARERVR
jgi:hypothetical protein